MRITHHKGMGNSQKTITETRLYLGSIEQKKKGNNAKCIELRVVSFCLLGLVCF